MKRLLVVLGTNHLVGHIVETVFGTELKPNDWEIKGVYGEELEKFEPEHGAVLVVDRRLADFMAEKFEYWCNLATYLVPFDETDFDNIHDCFRDLLSHTFVRQKTSSMVI